MDFFEIVDQAKREVTLFGEQDSLDSSLTHARTKKWAPATEPQASSKYKSAMQFSHFLHRAQFSFDYFEAN